MPFRVADPSHAPRRSALGWAVRIVAWLIGLAAALALCVVIIGALALALAYPNLPDVSALADYQPKLPLRVYTSEGKLIGEFGQERRNLTPVKNIPKIMINAVLATEDARFYQHHGIDYLGIARAALADIRHPFSQGASTITMQVARNIYLTKEKTFTRKAYEALLTFKLEHELTKDQILGIYMNQIYLGNRAYGFAAASEAYFGTPLKNITIAQAAMLAGLPKSPSGNNPLVNPERARARQLYIIDRMADLGYITPEQAQQAKAEPLKVRASGDAFDVRAAYAAEMVRQMMLAQYGEEAYTRGLNVYTTLVAADQSAADQALRRGIIDYESHRPYRGPEQFIALPQNPDDLDDAIDDALDDHPDSGNLLAAVVINASPSKVTVQRPDGDLIDITGDGLKPVQSGLSAKALPAIRIRPGAVVRIVKITPKKGGQPQWRVTQLPQVQGALVALDPRNGTIKALAGGFDFNLNKFNHVTQAWRQPGSSFKPFIYSAALEKGFSPASVVDDAPLYFDAATNGGQAWEPKDYEGTFEGPMSLKRALAESKNLVSIRVLQAITPQYAQQWITRFGFDAARHPAYLTMALGAGSVTPMQMAAAYSAFANGGYRVNPMLIERITDQSGKVLLDSQPTPPAEATRAISARNAFIMDTLLNEVTRSGTGARAQATLQRPDLYGKTGTTNDAMDAWFAGFQPTLTTIVWMGYDTPRSLGVRETGGGLSLPVWIDFMQTALKGVPVAPLAPPAGVTQVNSDWYYDENAHGSGITYLNSADAPAAPATPASAPDSGERDRILNMFKN
ncbi:MAG: penicillin-binding protein 1A [Burkholderiaceae bacterium]|nr:penicillin-binding protein 1A [Burkholderiaceae bacterium]